MQNSDSQNVDKNIVDRTQRKPNEAVMNAVKDKREQLQHGGSITKSYAREMIVFHTNSVLEGAAIGPLLVIATSHPMDLFSGRHNAASFTICSDSFQKGM